MENFWTQFPFFVINIKKQVKRDPEITLYRSGFKWVKKIKI